MTTLPICSLALATAGYELGGGAGCLIVTRHASIEQSRAREKGGEQKAEQISPKGAIVKFIVKFGQNLCLLRFKFCLTRVFKSVWDNGSFWLSVVIWSFQTNTISLASVCSATISYIHVVCTVCGLQKRRKLGKMGRASGQTAASILSRSTLTILWQKILDLFLF